MQYTEYTPNYGTNQTHINKSNPGKPERYYYSTLTSNSHKSFYELFEAATKVYGNAITPVMPITIDEAMMVYQLFMLDHPEVFWLGLEVSYSRIGDNVTDFSLSRKYSVTEAAEMANAIDNVVNSIIALIPDNATDMEAEIIIVNWLKDHITYGYSEFNCYTLYGCLVERTCVCEGYSEAFQYICGKIGIPATSVTGVANTGNALEGHKWNALKIGGKWYQLDVTWVDVATNHGVLYINNNAFIASDHTADPDIQPRLPEFTATDAEYLRYYGLYIDSAAGGTSTFSFDKTLFRTVVHFKATLTDEYYYNCAMIKVAPGLNGETFINQLETKPKAVKDAFAAAALGDGFKYDSYAYEMVDTDTILFWFYRQK